MIITHSIFSNNCKEVKLSEKAEKIYYAIWDMDIEYDMIFNDEIEDYIPVYKVLGTERKNVFFTEEELNGYLETLYEVYKDKGLI